MYVCMYVCVYVIVMRCTLCQIVTKPIKICMCVCVYVIVMRCTLPNLYVCVYVCMCVCDSNEMHIHIHIHIHIHMHIHTYIRSNEMHIVAVVPHASVPCVATVLTNEISRYVRSGWVMSQSTLVPLHIHTYIHT